MSVNYLNVLHRVAKRHGLHVGLEWGNGPGVLFVTKPKSGVRVNELPVRDLRRSLDAAADILTAWIENSERGVR